MSKVNRERQLKTFILIDTLSVSDFNGKIDDVIKFLQEKKAAWHGYLNIRIDASQHYDDVSIELYGDRLETDDEYAARIKIEERLIKDKDQKKKEEEKAEKALYYRLKKKYGK